MPKLFCMKCGKTITGRYRKIWCENCLIQEYIKQKNMAKNQAVADEELDEEIPVEKPKKEEEE